MAGSKLAVRGTGPVWMALVSAVVGCGVTGARGPTGATNDGTADPNDPPVVGSEPGFISRNDGGGNLAERVGGASYTGLAAGPLADGSLTLSFDADGVLTSMGGAVLGEFFGFPLGTDVFFDFATPSVTGTYRVEGLPDRGLAEFLASTEQSIDPLSVVVSLVGDSLLIAVNYSADLDTPTTGQGSVRLEGTLRFITNEDLQGALIFPGYQDSQAPTFTLVRE